MDAPQGRNPGQTRQHDYNTGNIFSKSIAPFDDTQLVSARVPFHDAAAGTVPPPGRQKLRRCVRLFRVPLGSRDGGPEPFDSTFLRGHKMVDHVTHHEMEQEKRRRHLELQRFIRKQMKEKEQAPLIEQEQKSNILTGEDVIVTSQARLVITVNTVETGTDTIAIVRSEDATLVTATRIMMTATLIDIATDDHL